MEMELQTFLYRVVRLRQGCMLLRRELTETTVNYKLTRITLEPSARFISACMLRRKAPPKSGPSARYAGDCGMATTEFSSVARPVTYFLQLIWQCRGAMILSIVLKIAQSVA